MKVILCLTNGKCDAYTKRSTKNLMKIEEAQKMCAEDKNYYIAWTYGESDRFYSSKKMAEGDRDYRNVPEYAPTKKKAAEYWPAYRCLVAEKCGLEYDVMYDKIEED